MIYQINEFTRLSTLKYKTLVTLQPFNLTTLQTDNLTSLQHYNLTILQPYKPSDHHNHKNQWFCVGLVYCYKLLGRVLGIRLPVRDCMCPHYMLFHWSRLNWSKIKLIAFMWLSSRACHLVFLKVVPNTFGCVSYCGALTGRTDGGGQKLLSNSVTRTLHLHTLRHQYQQKSNKTCFFTVFFFF